MYHAHDQVSSGAAGMILLEGQRPRLFDLGSDQHLTDTEDVGMAMRMWRRFRHARSTFVGTVAVVLVALDRIGFLRWRRFLAGTTCMTVDSRWHDAASFNRQ